MYINCKYKVQGSFLHTTSVYIYRYIQIVYMHALYFEFVHSMCIVLSIYIYIYIHNAVYVYTVFTRNMPMGCCVETLVESNKMLPNPLVLIALSEWAATGCPSAPILFMEEIPSPTTWDVQNLVNNGIKSYQPQLDSRISSINSTYVYDPKLFSKIAQKQTTTKTASSPRKKTAKISWEMQKFNYCLDGLRGLSPLKLQTNQPKQEDLRP